MTRRSILSFLNPKPRERPIHNYATIGDLPIELLLEIIDYLDHDPVYVACLALTCHSLANIFDSYIKHPLLQFPIRKQLCADKSYGLRHGKGSPKPDRLRFLRILEKGNDQWAFCSRCVKLHPVEQFSFTNRNLKPSRNRFCRLGRKSTLVDVCPGVVVCFQDKKGLVQAAKEQGMVDIWRDRPAREYKITIRYNAYVRIRTRVVARIHEGDELSIAVRYQWTDSRLSARHPKKGSLDNELNWFSTLRFCPHCWYAFRQLELGIKLGSFQASKTTCRECKTRFRANREGSTYWVDVSLYFGTSTDDRPDKTWLDHTSSGYYRYIGHHI
ncbi:hypothetical protein BJX64DRAFT_293971 [Aspergillus heterothallicus]